EWVLGASHEQASDQIVCAVDEANGALLARNPFNADFADAVAFADVSIRPHSFLADRTQFLGRNGSPAAPTALGQRRLSGRVAPGVDPCAALMAAVELKPGEEKEVVFLLGQAPSLEEARRLLRIYREPGRVQQAIEEVQQLWDTILSAVHVRTPDPGLDILLNRWLLYQVLSCR